MSDNVNDKLLPANTSISEWIKFTEWRFPSARVYKTSLNKLKDIGFTCFLDAITQPALIVQRLKEKQHNVNSCKEVLKHLSIMSKAIEEDPKLASMFTTVKSLEYKDYTKRYVKPAFDMCNHSSHSSDENEDEHKIDLEELHLSAQITSTQSKSLEDTPLGELKKFQIEELFAKEAIQESSSHAVKRLSLDMKHIIEHINIQDKKIETLTSLVTILLRAAKGRAARESIDILMKETFKPSPTLISTQILSTEPDNEDCLDDME